MLQFVFFYKVPLQFLRELKRLKLNKSTHTGKGGAGLTDNVIKHTKSLHEARNSTWGSNCLKPLFMCPFPHEGTSGLNTNICHIPSITSEASCASEKPRLTLEIKSTPVIISFSNLRLKRDLQSMNATLSRESKFPPNLFYGRSISSPLSWKAGQPNINWT